MTLPHGPDLQEALIWALQHIFVLPVALIATVTAVASWIRLWRDAREAGETVQSAVELLSRFLGDSRAPLLRLLISQSASLLLTAFLVRVLEGGFEARFGVDIPAAPILWCFVAYYMILDIYLLRNYSEPWLGAALIASVAAPIIAVCGITVSLAGSSQITAENMGIAAGAWLVLAILWHRLFTLGTESMFRLRQVLNRRAKQF